MSDHDFQKINNHVVDERAQVNYVVKRNEQLDLVLTQHKIRMQKQSSDNINESTGAVDSNDGNIGKGTDGAVESKNSNGAVLVPTDQVESDGTTKDIAEETVDPVVEHSILTPASPNIKKFIAFANRRTPLRNLYLP